MSDLALPLGWTDATIGDIAERPIEQSRPTGTGQFLYVDISSIDRSTKRIVDAKMLPVGAAPSRARQRLKPGDVLISMTRPNLNAVAIIPDTMNDAIGSTGFFVLRRSEVDPHWLFYLAQTKDFVYSMSALVLGVLYPAVRPKDIATYGFALPPRGEQSRIVAELEKQFTRLDAAVAALKRVQANLKRYRAAVLKAACEGRLVPTEAELARKEGRSYETGEQLLTRILKERRAKWEADQLAKLHVSGKAPKSDECRKKYEEPTPPEARNLQTLPPGWCWASFGQMLWGLRSGTAQTSGREATDYPVLRSSAVRPGRIDFDDLNYLREDQSRKLDNYVQKGDVLITRLSGSLEYVGVCALVVTLPSNPVQYPDRLFCGKLVAGVNGKFLSYCFCHQPLRVVLEQAAKSTAGHQRISMSDLYLLTFPLPTVAEQQRIVSEVEKRLSVIDELQSTIESNFKRADRLRQSILKRAFEGKLVPQDPNDEPASALLARIRTERNSRSASANSRRSRLRRNANKPDAVGVP